MENKHCAESFEAAQGFDPGDSAGARDRGRQDEENRDEHAAIRRNEATGGVLAEIYSTAGVSQVP